MIYTVNDIARRAGVERRTAQLWADRGVVRALERTDMQGPGKYRRFGADELTLAGVIGAVAKLGMRIGELSEVADAFRPFLRKFIEDGIDVVFIFKGKGRLTVSAILPLCDSAIVLSLKLVLKNV